MRKVLARDDLRLALCRVLRIPHRQGRQIINLIVHTIIEALCRGEKVEIQNLGVFEVVHWKARNRDPQILQTPHGPRTIPGLRRESVRIRFRPSVATLLARVKNSFYAGKLKPIVVIPRQLGKLAAKKPLPKPRDGATGV